MKKTGRTAPRLAWVLWALTFGEIVAFAVLLRTRWPLITSSRATTLQVGLIGIVYPAVGALIASRRPRNRIGWIFLVIGLSAAASALASALSTDAPLAQTGTPFGADIGAWLNQWVWGPAWISIPTFVLLLFPDGRLPSQRFRYIARVAWFAIAATVVGGMLSPDNSSTPGFRNPIVVLPRPVDLISVLGVAATVVAGVGSLIGLVYRFRRARGDEREQLKWFVFAGIATVVMYVGLTASVKGPLQTLGFVAIPLLPIATAIAILRYRLYDIDRIISRTLSYAILTLFLGGAFALVALVPTVLIGAGAKTPEWLIATATLLVVALFRPVRRRVQDSIDHRFNRRRYDAERTIEAFSQRLRDEIDMDALRTELVDVVQRTMQPSSAALWLRQT